MKLLWLATFLAVALTCLAGCLVTEEYDTYDKLRQEGSSDIRVMSRDSTVYDLSSYTVLDSALQGIGIHKVRGGEEHFEGAIPFREIVYVQGQQFSFFRTLLAATSIGVVAYYAGSASKTNGLRIWRPSGGGGSCPYVYAWDGDRYQIQGEVFGTAFGKALETSTACMLPAVVAQDGVVRVRLTNERPETHYLNSVSLLSCQAPANSDVLLDTDGSAWPVTKPLPPLTGPTGTQKKDGIFWKSDLGHTRLGEGFRDTVELTMPKPGHPTEGSFIVHAMNTQLINAVYDIVFRYLGDQSLKFLYEVEYNRELIAKLKEWINDCSLNIELWKDGKWVKAGTIPPEANNVAFSKIVRMNTAGIKGQELRVRLTALADVWQIDGVAVDWTDTFPLVSSEQPVLSVNHSATGPVRDALQKEDRDYSVLFPGERIDMTFSPRTSVGKGRVFYFLKASGYLYEWLPRERTEELPALFAFLGSDRVSVVSHMVRQRDTFLKLVYGRWRELREL